MTRPKDPQTVGIDVEALAKRLPTMRLDQIGDIVNQAWPKVYFGALPYLVALRRLDSIEQNYGYDSGKEIVLYFLANAQRWHGPVAKLVKAELKRRAGVK